MLTDCNIFREELCGRSKSFIGCVRQTVHMLISVGDLLHELQDNFHMLHSTGCATASVWTVAVAVYK